MELVFPLIIAVCAIAAFYFLFPSLFGQSDKRTREAISRLHTETEGHLGDDESMKAALRSDALSNSPAMDALLKKIPGAQDRYIELQRAGFKSGYLTWVVGVLVFFVFVVWALQSMGLPLIVAAILGGIVTKIGANKFLAYRKEKRALDFLNLFPDAVDMIVRSVRSGHPVATALGMIGENMDPPVGEEFQQVVDEIEYGRSMTDALNRMAARVGEADVQFFVVVLTVQQETGGNLGEVLSNLSNILRQRKQMRLKIRAMTAEGRMTAYILGALPLVVVGVLHLLSPDYLTPLFEDPVGNFILGLSITMVLSAFLVVRKMVKIDI